MQLVEPTAWNTKPTALTVLVADTALAERAAWQQGVPGTTVLIRRDETPFIFRYGSGTQGVLSLPELPAGDYWIWAEKHPSGSDLDAPVLAPPALGGGRRVRLVRGSDEALELRGQKNGSLVISEFYYHLLPMSVFGEGVNYWLHWYIELFNDADTTIYLDGKIVGAGFNYNLDTDLWPCSATEGFRSDPRGVWSQRFQAFPGAGHDHPVAPGETVVIAEQAIDHSTVYPGLPDLSHADFQFAWPNRAQNPTVPTLLPIQISTGVYQTLFYTGPEAVFVAMPVDVGSLERQRGKYSGDFALFPRGVILDLAVLDLTYRVGPQTVAPYCRTLVDTSLDALLAFVRPSDSYQGDSTHLLSAQRRVLGNGHLQRTGTSAVDWEIRARSPGKVP